jgi:hypothetical protein
MTNFNQTADFLDRITESKRCRSGGEAKKGHVKMKFAIQVTEARLSWGGPIPLCQEYPFQNTSLASTNPRNAEGYLKLFFKFDQFCPKIPTSIKNPIFPDT